jgi:photosystem II stability/assembly factor-like uncharacterized protein
VAGSADGTKWVAAAIGYAGEYGGIYTSTNSGFNWVQRTNVPLSTWGSVACSADGKRLVAAESFGFIYTSTNAGATWVSNSAPYAPWAAVASSADGTRLVAVAQAKGIFISTNEGLDWAQATGAPTNFWQGVSSTADGMKLLVEAPEGYLNNMPGPIYFSLDGGVTWALNSVPGQSWIAVASSADGSRLVASAYGTEGSVFTSTDGGATWVSNSVPNSYFSSIASSADGGRLAATDQGQSAIWLSRSVPAPDLNISTTNAHPLVSWVVPSTNFVLQQVTGSFAGKWVTLTNKPKLNLTTLRNEVTLPVPSTNVFFRLAP